MSTLRYVGRPADSDFSIIHKKYEDDRYGVIKVDNPYITSEISTQAVPLVTPSYVDTQDSLRARKSNVDTADANYLPTTIVGQANGVVPLDASSYVDHAYLPTLTTNRKPVILTSPTIIISGDRAVSTTNIKEYQAATLTINDPGYPYIPLLFAQVQGGSVGGSAANRLMGTGSFGQMAILKTDDDTKYSWNLCTSHKTRAYHTCVPFADSNIDPTARPPLNGTFTFGLYLSCFSGSAYTFNSTNLLFYALVMPGF